MLTDRVKQFATENHRGVLTCFRKNGMPQISIVTCGAYGEGAAFSTTADRVKLINLQRDSRCSLMIAKDDWWGYVVLEGKATILSADLDLDAQTKWRQRFPSLQDARQDWQGVIPVQVASSPKDG